MFSFSLHM